MALEGVVFDFDGVVADTEPLHLQVFQTLLESEGIPFTADEYYERYLGFDDVGVFEALERDKGLQLRNGRMDALMARKTAIFQSLARSRPVLFPGAAACLRACAASVPVAIASGALKEEIRLILDAAGLDGLVPVIVAAGDTAGSKPAPDPYLRALERLADGREQPLRPGRVVAIEDSRWGLQSARAAGLRTVALTTSYPAAQLGQADLVLPDISAVSVQLLDRLCSSAAGVSRR